MSHELCSAAVPHSLGTSCSFRLLSRRAPLAPARVTMHNSKSLNYLSLELHLRIVQLLDPTSRLALLRVARRFYWTLRNHVAILNLGYLTSLSLSTPFCLREPCTFPADSPSYWSESSEDEDEVEGEITCGRTPLLVHKVALATTKPGSKGCTLTEKRLQLHVMSPHFVFGDHMCPFKVDRDRLFLDDPKKYWSSHPPRFSGRSFKHDRPWYKDDRRFVLDWVKHCANGANLVRATGPLMRTRVECRICRNGSCVRTTRVEFPSRYPGLYDTDSFCSMPCPACVDYRWKEGSCMAID